MGLSGLAARGTPHPGSITAAPVVRFTGTPVTGGAPFAVVFTDTSGRTPTSWLWQKNSGSGWVNFAGTPTAQNPTETFQQGEWSVRLTATNAGGSTTYTRTDYINATDLAPTVLSTTVAADGVTVTRVFSEAVTGFQNGWGDFGLSDGSVRHGTDYTSGNGTATIVFTCEDNLYQGTTYTDEYAVGGGNITDLAGNALAIYTGAAVTNNSTQFTPANLTGLQLWGDMTGPLWSDVGRTTHPAIDGADVDWWDDKSGNSRNLASSNQGVTNIYQPAAGPTGGAAVRWTSGQAAMGLDAGSFITGKTMTMAVVFKASVATNTKSLLIGRGENAGFGFCIGIEAATGKCFMSVPLSGGTLTLKTAGDVRGAWCVAVGSIGTVNGGGRDAFLKCTGQSIVTASGTDTALTFNGSVVAAWIADCCSVISPNVPTFGGIKDISAFYVTNTANSSADTTTLEANTKTYYGVP